MKFMAIIFVSVEIRSKLKNNKQQKLKKLCKTSFSKHKFLL